MSGRLNGKVGPGNGVGVHIVGWEFSAFRVGLWNNGKRKLLEEGLGLGGA